MSPVPEDAATRELLRRCRHGDASARDGLLRQYAPMVKYIAGRVASGLPATVDRSELLSYGMEGLLEAIDRYDPDHGARFTTFAAARIKGAMFDELRSLDWVPRTLRDKHRAVRAAVSELEFRLGGTPTQQQIAAELSVEVDDLRVTMTEIVRTEVSVLDAAEHGDVPLAEQLRSPPTLDPQSAYDEPEAHGRLADAVGELPARQRDALVLYFYEGMTLAQVGRAMSVTESRASQLRTSALLALRDRLASYSRSTT